MSGLNGLRKAAFQSLGVLLAASLTVPMSLAQVVGPQLPRQKPVKETMVEKAFSKLLGKKTDEEAKAGEGEAKTVEPEKPVMAVPPEAPREVKRPPMLTQPPLTQARIEPPQVDDENPPIRSHPRLDDPANPLGFADAENRLKKYMTLVEANRYAEAKPGLFQLRQWLVDVTEAHIGLYKTLNQVPSARAQAELEKELALMFAQLRDRAMMEAAKVYIAEKDYHKAVKELTEVVKSQPKSRLGLRSYELLQEIGFTEKLQLAQ